MHEVMRTLREARGWSKAELARRATMNAATVGLIESGRLRPYPAQLQKLADAFEVPVAELTGEQAASA